jgi:DNA-binding MarR family transcriptional regulator
MTDDLFLGAAAGDQRIDEVARQIDLHRMPGYLVRRLDSRAAALFERHTGQTALTPRQFGLLQVVHRAGVVLQSQLAADLHLDRSTLGEMLVRMVDRGLVERTPTPADRRTSEVRLTALGETTLMDNTAGALAAQRAFLAPLPDYLRPLFLKSLEILADAAADEPSTDEKST